MTRSSPTLPQVPRSDAQMVRLQQLVARVLDGDPELQRLNAIASLMEVYAECGAVVETE